MVILLYYYVLGNANRNLLKIIVLLATEIKFLEESTNDSGDTCSCRSKTGYKTCQISCLLAVMQLELKPIREDMGVCSYWI